MLTSLYFSKGQAINSLTGRFPTLKMLIKLSRLFSISSKMIQSQESASFTMTKHHYLISRRIISLVSLISLASVVCISSIGSISSVSTISSSEMRNEKIPRVKRKQACQPLVDKPALHNNASANLSVNEIPKPLNKKDNAKRIIFVNYQLILTDQASGPKNDNVTIPKQRKNIFQRAANFFSQLRKTKVSGPEQQQK